MPGITSQALELLNPTMQDPQWLVAAAGIAVGGIVGDVRKQRLEHRIFNGLAVADPDNASRHQKNFNRTRLEDRLRHYGAIAFLSFGALQLTHPYTTHSVTEGRASVVLPVDYQYLASDMLSTDGSPISRMQAAENGALDAARDRNVPFTFVVQGGSADVVDSTPATGKDLQATRQKIKAAINPVMQNNDSLGDGAKQALGQAGDSANKVILLASNFGNGDTEAGQRSTLKAVVKNSRQPGSNSAIYAIVLGRGNATAKLPVGNIAAPVDLPGFQKMLGADHVQTAQSTRQVEQDIDKIVDANLIDTTRTPSHGYGDIAIAGAITASTLSVKRRISGVIKARKQKEPQ